MADHAAGHDEAELVDGISRVRHEDDVAWPGDGLRHIGEAFLGAERGDDLRLGVELHAEAARVIGALRPPQALDAARRRIAAGARYRAPSRSASARYASGVGMSGLPMPKSMMSSPRARACALSLLTCSKTYGGSRLILWKSLFTRLSRRSPRPAIPMPNGWAFEPQKRAPGQEAPSRVLRPNYAAWAGLTDAVVCRRPIPCASPARFAGRRSPPSALPGSGFSRAAWWRCQRTMATARRRLRNWSSRPK